MKRSLRVLLCLTPLLAFGAVPAMAKFAGPIKMASLESAPFCAWTSSADAQQKAGASAKIRLAGCSCCGWETTANGHKMCNHQCCN